MRRRLAIALTVSASLVLTAGCASTPAREPVGATPAREPVDSTPVREPVDATPVQSPERPGKAEVAPPPPREARVEDARVGEVLARVDEVNARLSKLWASRNRRTPVAILHVQFRPDREDLDDGAQAALGHVLQELGRNESLVVNLEGYTDMRGSREHNLELSRRRAEAVRLYLVEHGVELSRIHAIGRGPLTDAAVSADRKRRVTIKLIAPSE